MGMYDEVRVPCPSCGVVYYAQTKSGPCTLTGYSLEEAPDDVIANVNRHAPFECEDCGTIFHVVLEVPPVPQIKRTVKVYAPPTEEV
jgi:uncharacterized Zn finger protein